MNGTDACEHVCVNTEGDFVCECHQGYTLSNQTHCEGNIASYRIQTLFVREPPYCSELMFLIQTLMSVPC